MKKTIFIFLFLPLLAISQQKPAGWLTPYANAVFNNGKIIYSVSNMQQHMNTRLLPLMLPRDLVQLRIDHHPATVTGKYIGESQTKIRDYVNTEPVSLRGIKAQEEYLRLTAMVLLWDLKLSDYNKNEIQRLKNGTDKKIAGEAGIVLKVLEVFDENRK